MKIAETSRNMRISVVILTIRKPGAMTDKERKKIAMWLHLHAERLVKDGKYYNDTGYFRARVIP